MGNTLQVQQGGYFGPIKTIKNKANHTVDIQSFSFGDGNTARHAHEYEKKWDWSSMTRKLTFNKETMFYQDGNSCTSLLNQLHNSTKNVYRDKNGKTFQVMNF